MACHWLKMKDGTVVHLNLGRQRSKRCKFCTHGSGDLLCDYQVGVNNTGRPKTCDAPMCVRCATRVAVEVDHCPDHRGKKPWVAPTAQESLF